MTLVDWPQPMLVQLLTKGMMLSTKTSVSSAENPNTRNTHPISVHGLVMVKRQNRTGQTCNLIMYQVVTTKEPRLDDLPLGYSP